MQQFEWIEAHSASQASSLASITVADAMTTQSGRLADDGATIIKAGGIDLLDLMKEGLIAPKLLVNLRRAAGLGRIVQENDGTLRIGSMVTLAQIAIHRLIRERYTALADATEQSASPQIRHVATLGGNLLQRPRCWYFRSAHYHCARKGGEGCFAFAGENQYHAIFDHQGCAIVHPSTAATALVALEARVELEAGGGENREMRLEDFFLLPTTNLHCENDLKPGEILTAITLPPIPPGSRSIHLKQGEKDSFDWPIADVAVWLELDRGGICEKASIVLGAAAPVPRRAREAEAAIIGKRVSEDAANAAGRAALAGAAPLSKNAYKLPIFETLVRRAILAAAGRA
jgi:xanthine dehydrogenase YagS FAD-binding subunit